MGTRTLETIIDECLAKDIDEISITTSQDVEGDGSGIVIRYRVRSTPPSTHLRSIMVPFVDLTDPQKTTLRNVIAWALNKIKAVEGPFV